MRRSLRPTSSLFSFFERDFFCPCYVLPRTTCTVHDFVRTCSSKNCFLNKSNRSVVVVVFLPGQREPSGTTCAPHYVVRVRRVVRVNCWQVLRARLILWYVFAFVFHLYLLPWQHEPRWRWHHGLLRYFLTVRSIYLYLYLYLYTYFEVYVLRGSYIIYIYALVPVCALHSYYH